MIPKISRSVDDIDDAFVAVEALDEAEDVVESVDPEAMEADDEKFNVGESPNSVDLFLDLIPKKSLNSESFELLDVLELDRLVFALRLLKLLGPFFRVLAEGGSNKNEVDSIML